MRTTCWEEARRVLGPGTAADDAAQEAAIKAWRHHASCRTPEQPRPWLAAIARREPFRLLGPPRAESLEAAAEPFVAATDARVALALDVRRALAELSESDQRLLLARYWVICRNGRSRTCSACPTARLKSGSIASAHWRRLTLREP